MPSAIRTLDGRVIQEKACATDSVSGLAPRRRRTPGQSGRRSGRRPARQDAIRMLPRRRAARPSRSPAPSARDERPDGDHQADIDRDGEEQDDGGEADAAGQARVAEPGDVEQREQIDDEDGDQADRAGCRHHETWRMVEPATKRGRTPARLHRVSRQAEPPSIRRPVLAEDVARLRVEAVRLRRGVGERLRRHAAPSTRSRRPSTRRLLHHQARDVALAHVLDDARGRGAARRPAPRAPRGRRRAPIRRSPASGNPRRAFMRSIAWMRS